MGPLKDQGPDIFGGMIRMQVIAFADMEGNMIEVLAHQLRGTDGFYHDIQ